MFSPLSALPAALLNDATSPPYLSRTPTVPALFLPHLSHSSNPLLLLPPLISPQRNAAIPSKSRLTNYNVTFPLSACLPFASYSSRRLLPENRGRNFSSARLLDPQDHLLPCATLISSFSLLRNRSLVSGACPSLTTPSHGRQACFSFSHHNKQA